MGVLQNHKDNMRLRILLSMWRTEHVASTPKISTILLRSCERMSTHLMHRHALRTISACPPLRLKRRAQQSIAHLLRRERQGPQVGQQAQRRKRMEFRVMALFGGRSP